MSNNRLFNQWLFLQKKRNRKIGLASILFMLMIITLVFLLFYSRAVIVILVIECIFMYRLYILYNKISQKMNKVADLLRYGTIEEQNEELNKD